MTPETLSRALDGAGPVKAVLPVHLGGRLCDTRALAELTCAAGAVVVEDACHAIGGRDREGRPVGACPASDAACFSFHPVKTLAAGEGGAVTLNDPARAARMRRLRNHGVSRDPADTAVVVAPDAEGRAEPYAYAQLELGWNLRMDEMSAALATSQLAKLDRFAAARRTLSEQYDAALAPLAPAVRPVARAADAGLHLYTVRLDDPALAARRGALISTLHAAGIGAQVHYIPLYRQPYFRARYGERSLPGSEAWFARALALPLHPSMTEADVERVAQALSTAIG